MMVLIHHLHIRNLVILIYSGVQIVFLELDHSGIRQPLFWNCPSWNNPRWV